jgi:hypothetical protein
MKHFIITILLWAALLAAAFTVGSHYLGFDRTAAAVGAALQNVGKQVDWDSSHNRIDR